MKDLKYNFLNDDFLVYEGVMPEEKTELYLPIFDTPKDISSWADKIITKYNEKGNVEETIPIAKDTGILAGKTWKDFTSSNQQDISEIQRSEPTIVTFQSNNQTIPQNTKNNAEIVINALMNDLGLSKAQAAGIAGVLTAESGIDPSKFNVREKKGTYTKSAANNLNKPYGHKNSPWSYGAGICSWTFTDRKEEALMGGLGISRQDAFKIITNKGIESLPLEMQIKMLEYELKNSPTLEGIRKCNTASEAAATYYCHNIAGSSKSTEKATQTEINNTNAKYAKVGAKSQVNIGMRYAENLM